MSKGYVIVAVKSIGKVDYLRHAMALSASIKKHCAINQTCLVTNYKLTQEQQQLFDHVVQINANATEWTQNILNQIYLYILQLWALQYIC